MPSEVAMFLDYKSIHRMVQNIEKIQSFQENQVRMYIEKNITYREQYAKLKQR
jgi:hypothetical protein